MTSAAASTVVAGAAALLIPLVCLQYWAPSYVFHGGFPLDDSWIHAVYARSLAHTAMLAYNPGIPANGETSPLWAVLLALPHLLSANPTTIVASIKILGLLLHAGTAFLAWTVARRLAAPPLIACTASALVALHPDLIAASVSGMEVPLATLLALWSILEILRGAPLWRLALACCLAPLGRPEVACIPIIFLLARAIGRPTSRTAATTATATTTTNATTTNATTIAMTAAALTGSLASFALLAVRNVAITGRPLPATFYAKVGSHGFPWLHVQAVGYTDLLGHFAIVGTLLLLVPVTLLALWTLLRPRLHDSAPNVDAAYANPLAPHARAAAPAAHAAAPPAAPDVYAAAAAGALFLTGLAFFTVSFTLIPPFDHAAFYHQRYALPGLPLVLIALPLLIDVVCHAAPAPRLLPYMRIAVAAALALSIVVALPARLRHLENDARNIDDVQVAEGKALAATAPTTIVWAVDAGAIRYFGNAFVVDMIGLNSPDLLSPDAQTFLAGHAPEYISFVNGWTSLDPASQARMQAVAFRPSTPYTVTSSPWMSVHYLTRCPPQQRGRYAIFQRAFDLTCAQ